MNKPSETQELERLISIRTSESFIILGIGMIALGISFFILRFAPLSVDSFSMLLVAGILIVCMLCSMIFPAAGILGLISAKRYGWFFIAFIPVLLGSIYGSRGLWALPVSPLSWSHQLLTGGLLFIGGLCLAVGISRRKNNHS